MVLRDVARNIMAQKVQNLLAAQQHQLFVDKQIQCDIPRASYGCDDVQVVSSNDRYNTNVNGAVHDLAIGNVFYGVEESYCQEKSTVTSFGENKIGNANQNDPSRRQTQMDVHGQYNTKIQITTPENHSSTFEIQFPTYNYGPTFQLDPAATKEILSCNPDMFMKALEASNTISLPPFEIINDKGNVEFNNKNRVRSDPNDETSRIGKIEKLSKCRNKQSSEISGSMYKMKADESSSTTVIAYPRVNVKHNNQTNNYIIKTAIPTLFTYGIGGVAFNYIHKGRKR